MPKPKIDLTLTVRVTKPNGTLVHEHTTKPKSFVRGIMDMLSPEFALTQGGTPQYWLTAIAGTSVLGYAPQNDNMNCNGGVSVIDRGIEIGDCGDGAGTVTTTGNNGYTSSYIYGIADAGGGQVDVNIGTHSVYAGDYVTITGTTNYNGTYVLLGVTATTFRITHAYVSSQIGYANWYQTVVYISPQYGSDITTGSRVTIAGTIDYNGTYVIRGPQDSYFAIYKTYTTAQWGTWALADGDLSVTVDDYKLQHRVRHGNTVGLMSYGNTSFTSPVTSGSERYFTMSRPFTNNTGSSKTLKEVGIYFRFWYVSSAFYTICGERTIDNVVVPAGDTVTYTYRFRVSV